MPPSDLKLELHHFGRHLLQLVEHHRPARGVGGHLLNTLQQLFTPLLKPRQFPVLEKRELDDHAALQFAESLSEVLRKRCSATMVAT
jgi:hypothetical protein